MHARHTRLQAAPEGLVPDMRRQLADPAERADEVGVAQVLQYVDGH